ncbi:MAG: GIY-YIG nuclease family protein [Candidatus Micrarchaeia archaeon]
MQIPCNRPIPHAPGVYLFKDEKGTNIYIGKAKDLKKRVSSYFRKRQENDKTAALVKKISSVDFIFTDNEEEAILLEGNLIKQHYPKYNIMLKDNAPLTYALITDEEFPRLLRVRKDRYGKIRGPKGKAYGPFMSGSARGMALGLLRKAFGIRTCNSPIPKRICLQFHLGNCPGPCEGKISREEYSLHVQKVRNLLSDQKKSEFIWMSLSRKCAKNPRRKILKKRLFCEMRCTLSAGLAQSRKWMR